MVERWKKEKKENRLFGRQVTKLQKQIFGMGGTVIIKGVTYHTGRNQNLGEIIEKIAKKEKHIEYIIINRKQIEKDTARKKGK